MGARPRDTTEGRRTLLGQALYGGFGEAWSLAVELAVTPLLFAVFGWWLDGRFGTRPVFLVSLFGIVATYSMLKALRAYKERVEKEQEGKPWTRRAR